MSTEQPQSEQQLSIGEQKKAREAWGILADSGNEKQQQEEQQGTTAEEKKARQAWSNLADNIYTANTLQVRQKVSHWAKTTSMHGIGKLAADDEAESPSVMVKLVWASLLMGSLGLLCYQVSQLAIKFSQYPSTTSRYAEDVNSVQFPAVTICPIHGMSQYRMTQHMTEMTSIAGYIFGVGPPVTKNVSAVAAAAAATAAVDANKTCEEKWRNTVSNTPAKDNYKMASFAMAMNSFNNSLLSRLTPNLQQILLDCVYYGMQCAPRDFVAFRNAAFGFCYTFNLEGTRTASSYGPMNSLQMTLALNQSDYAEDGYGDAGYRILIHEPKTYPFAEASGYHLSPGTSAQIGLTFFSHQTLPPPYGTCRDYTVADNARVNAYVNSSVVELQSKNTSTPAPATTVAYSHKACMRTCLQRAAIKRCGCFLPCSFATDAQRAAMKPCEIRPTVLAETNATSCNQLLKDVDCTQECKFPCFNQVYRAGISLGQFPALSYLSRLVELATASGYAADVARATKDGILMAFARSNFLRVSVFAEEIKIYRTEDSPSYQLKDLVSDCGGQAGFWLGLSILTVCEFMDLLSQLCRAYLHGPGK